MNIPAWAGIDVFAVLILTMIYISFRSSIDYQSPQQRTFFNMLLINIVILGTDSLSRLHSPSINHIVIPIAYGTYPILAYFWFHYLTAQLFAEHKPIRIWDIAMKALLIIDLLLAISSIFTGYAFYFDASGYHRGPFYALSNILGLAMILLPACFVIKHRRETDSKHFRVLLFFPLPPLIGQLLQIQYQEFPFLPCGIAFALITVFLNIQNRIMEFDFLTGAQTRRRLDQYMENKIRHATADNTFAAVMIDVDHFKTINDTYGHIVGDKVLIKTVELLKSCVRNDDFIGRYGGDEFCVILNVGDTEALEIVVQRIQAVFSAHTRRRDDDPSMALNISMGYALYDANSHMSLHEFQHYIDQIMYKNKHNKTCQ